MKSEKMTMSLLEKVPVRYIVIFMILFGNIFNYILRTNISIALVAMVNHTALPQENDTKSNQCGGNSSSGTGPPQEDGTFIWDEVITGEILAGFFYGYTCTQLIGGRLAELISGKHMFGVPMLLAAILTMLVPAAAKFDWRLLVGLRVVMGIVMGITYPAAYALYTSWIPEEEMNLLVVMAQSGAELGTVISLPMSSAIISSLGWEAVFYIQAGLTIIWFLLWMLLVSKSPADHWFISDGERQRIAEGVGLQVSATQLPLPWRQMLTSFPLWALMFGYFALNWIYYTLLSDLPQYLNSILGEDLSSNALLSSLPHLGMWILALLYGWLSDKVLKRGLIRLLNVRRTAYVAACLVPGLLLGCIGFLGCRTAAIESLLVLTIVLQGPGYSIGILPMNMAPNFAGTIAGIANALASVTGFLGPMVVAAFTEGHNTVDRWRDCFFVATALSVVGSLVVVFGITVKEQSWNRPVNADDVRRREASLDYTPEDAPEVDDQSPMKNVDSGL